jgi:hypothetical protein
MNGVVRHVPPRRGCACQGPQKARFFRRIFDVLVIPELVRGRKFDGNAGASPMCRRMLTDVPADRSMCGHAG